MHITKKQIIIIVVIVIVIGLALGLGLGLGLKSSNKNNNSRPILTQPILTQPQSPKWSQDTCNSYMNNCLSQSHGDMQALQNCAMIAQANGC
jgi:hypothetical protein